MKIATFNVNSINKRLRAVQDWLEKEKPDHLVLQELKCVAEKFPSAEIAEVGYHAHLVGQKSYNGLAILSAQPAKLRQSGLPGDENDLQARYLEIEDQDTIIAGLYAPNGNPVFHDDGQESEKFHYKLQWMDRLIKRAKELLETEKSIIITGDFNVIPTPNDVYNPDDWMNDALYHPKVLQRYRHLQNLGFWDGWRTMHPEKRAYSFWDYQRGRWQKGEGIRIDHFLLSPKAAERLVDCQIDPTPRGAPEPSDHTPVFCILSQ